MKINSQTHPRIYRQWREVCHRCSNELFKLKNPTYLDCTLDPSWTVFANFCTDYLLMFGSADYWDIDKDLLIKGNKVYSKDTCCLIPHEINSLIVTNAHRRGSLPIGVSFRNINTLKKPYYARCNIKHVLTNLGYFETPEEAFQAYKFAKEAEIRRIARFFRSKLDPRVYNILMSYEVNIHD